MLGYCIYGYFIFVNAGVLWGFWHFYVCECEGISLFSFLYFRWFYVFVMFVNGVVWLGFMLKTSIIVDDV